MRGTTLVELMVVLVILGVVASVSTLALTSLRPSPDAERVHLLSRARAAAARSGQPVSVPAADGSAIRFLPDGRALGPGVDPLTGDALDATH
jgi:prepilin-type N-terminal cleavage/methylation domain-containing protein